MSAPIRTYRGLIFCFLLAALVCPALAAQDDGQQSGKTRDRELLRNRPRQDEDDGAKLFLRPAIAIAAPGELVSMGLVVRGAQDVSRVPVTIRFDPAVLRVASVRVGRAWQDGPPPALLHDASSPGVVVIGIARLGRDAPAIPAEGELVRVTFEALAAGSTTLELERFALLGASSRAQSVEATPGRVVVR